jgi:hypothetical protein
LIYKIYQKKLTNELQIKYSFWWNVFGG